MAKKRLSKDDKEFLIETALELGACVTHHTVGRQRHYELSADAHARSTLGKKLARLRELGDLTGA